MFKKFLTSLAVLGFIVGAGVPSFAAPTPPPFVLPTPKPPENQPITQEQINQAKIDQIYNYLTNTLAPAVSTGGVTSVTAGSSKIVIGGTGSAPTVDLATTIILTGLTTTNLTSTNFTTANETISSLTASQSVCTDGSKNLISCAGVSNPITFTFSNSFPRVHTSTFGQFNVSNSGTNVQGKSSMFADTQQSGANSVSEVEFAASDQNATTGGYAAIGNIGITSQNVPCTLFSHGAQITLQFGDSPTCYNAQGGHNFYAPNISTGTHVACFVGNALQSTGCGGVAVSSTVTCAGGGAACTGTITPSTITLPATNEATCLSGNNGNPQGTQIYWTISGTTATLGISGANALTSQAVAYKVICY